jgi:hypothetical protein
LLFIKLLSLGWIVSLEPRLAASDQAKPLANYMNTRSFRTPRGTVEQPLVQRLPFALKLLTSRASLVGGLRAQAGISMQDQLFAPYP